MPRAMATSTMLATPTLRMMRRRLRAAVENVVRSVTSVCSAGRLPKSVDARVTAADAGMRAGASEWRRRPEGGALGRLPGAEGGRGGVGESEGNWPVPKDGCTRWNAGGVGWLRGGCEGGAGVGGAERAA